MYILFLECVLCFRVYSFSESVLYLVYYSFYIWYIN